MRTFALLTAACSVALLTAVTTAQQAPAANRRAAARADAAPEYRLVGTVKDIMLGLIDPAADEIWESVSTEITREGTVEHMPTTAEEWAAVEHNALLLAESANLLKMPGRVVARPEELHGKSTTDPAELTPAQIGERIARDRATYIKFAEGLQTTAMQAIEAARARNSERLFQAGEQIYNACVACHRTYWYPGSFEPTAFRP